jgi:hypothetical protein
MKAGQGKILKFNLSILKHNYKENTDKKFFAVLNLQLIIESLFYFYHSFAER